MSVSLYSAFIAASALLILTPGPTVALITSNAARYGLCSGLTTVAGSCAAMSLHLLAVCFGLSAFLAALGGALFWLKWAGAAYLVYLAIKALRAPPLSAEDAATPGRPTGRRVFVEAFAVSLSNPKVLLFYAAFFPVFLSPERAAAPQLALMSATFLAVAAAIDSGWAMLGARARPLLIRAGRWGNRVSAGVLLTAAAGLASLRRA